VRVADLQKIEGWGHAAQAVPLVVSELEAAEDAFDEFEQTAVHAHADLLRGQKQRASIVLSKEALKETRTGCLATAHIDRNLLRSAELSWPESGPTWKRT